MKNKLKAWFTKKRIIWAVVILAILAAGYFLFFNKKTVQETLTVHPADFLQQVSASGKIIAKENLDLSFQEPGQVSTVTVAVGNTVYSGQLLATQNSGELQAQLAGQQAGIKLQQAKLDQLLAGNSPEDIQIAKDSVTLAQQNIDSAYTDASNVLDNAYAAIYGAYTNANYIQQTYFNVNDQESFVVRDQKATILANANDAKKFADVVKSNSNQSDQDAYILHVISDLNSTYSNLNTIRQVCEGSTYYSKVSTSDKALLDTQKTTVNTALANITSLQSNIASYKVALTKAKNELNLKQALPRSSDIAVYQAQLDQAKADEQHILAQVNKKRIYSPIDGVVTAVNAKVGRIFSSQDVAISVISKNNFQIESYVPQINISLIKVGQDTQVTLDAYNDAMFLAKVISIDPAETIQDGVSTYKVTLAFVDDSDVRIKSGMTGTITITTEKKSNIISIPQGAVQIKNGQKFVRVKTGDKPENVTEKTVTTRSVSSSGNVEITSGLSDGDTVVLN